MSPKKTIRRTASRDHWEAQLDETRPKRREPLSVERIVTAALGLVATEGYDALTIRKIAGTLGATPGALYAHVTDKAELDDLMIGELCSCVVVPPPDPAWWFEQVTDVCRQLRDQYLAHPGIARASFDTTPHSLAAWHIYEGLLAIMTAAGVPLRTAAAAADAAFLYIGAYSVVSPRRSDHLDRAELADRFRRLPADRFPLISAHADEITAGEGHERFDATLELLLGGLTAPSRPEGEIHGD